MSLLDHSNRRHGKSLALLIAFLVLSSISVLWAWNTLAVDMFAQPEMPFKHGLAFMLAVFVVGSTGSVAKRIFTRGHGE
jgi:hypothetical protein